MSLRTQRFLSLSQTIPSKLTLPSSWWCQHLCNLHHISSSDICRLAKRSLFLALMKRILPFLYPGKCKRKVKIDETTANDHSTSYRRIECRHRRRQKKSLKCKVDSTCQVKCTLQRVKKISNAAASFALQIYSIEFLFSKIRIRFYVTIVGTGCVYSDARNMKKCSRTSPSKSSHVVTKLHAHQSKSTCDFAYTICVASTPK
ncbi:hypothetical protein EGR_10337 [Echinococcus granulosus]|uniref:Uncharacterized protein n=1 Tax=Echinococcus granulosus TaxID=6210 RepID=W6U1A0_ECHGR|nr:hypothetical protein EGR_10337 [Echinococcus granulosus]EUB54808.1 hypothetical protein EGR_10337 [Echinococcus granulosus]